MQARVHPGFAKDAKRKIATAARAVAVNRNSSPVEISNPAITQAMRPITKAAARIKPPEAKNQPRGMCGHHSAITIASAGIAGMT